MAITPAAGYQIDPNNSNGVVPISQAAVNNPNANYFSQQTPVAQAPTTPVPTQTTPSAPVAKPTQTATPTPTPAPTATPTPAPTTQPTATQTGQLTAPANGSVVDLLNQSGQDSSYAARKQLASQYGIQGYQGTAAQNQELSKKYIDAHNALKSTATPQNAAEARNALSNYQDENSSADQAQQGDPTQQFMDKYGSMNPVEANIFQQLSGLLSTSNTQQSLVDTYNQLSQQENIPGLKLQLANLNTIMSGTQDDIRKEITNAGGFATESQVQALTTARNKTLLTQASYLQNTLNSANDYVDQIVSLTKADKTQASQDLQQKLGIANTLVTMSNNMENAARDNYKTIVDSVGWEGLAKSVDGNPDQAKNIEQIMGLQPGELQTLSTIKKPLTAMEQAQLTGQNLQNQKLQADLKAGPAVSTSLQNFGTTADPHYKLINSKTGATIADYGSTAPQGNSPLQIANQQQTISDTQALLNNPALNTAVGPNALARGEIPVPFFDNPSYSPNVYSGAKSNFVAGVQQITQQLTLQNLQNAKANGATFGALSEGELSLLSSAASKLDSWAIKDKAGNVTGYNVDEKDFKTELQKINNFQKLDFVLKGGDPASVNVQEQGDGTLWTQNSDGTYTQIQ